MDCILTPTTAFTVLEEQVFDEFSVNRVRRYSIPTDSATSARIPPAAVHDSKD